MMDGQDSDGLQHKSFIQVKIYLKYMTSSDGYWERSVVLVVVNTGGAACALS